MRTIGPLNANQKTRHLPDAKTRRLIDPAPTAGTLAGRRQAGVKGLTGA